MRWLWKWFECNFYQTVFVVDSFRSFDSFKARMHFYWLNSMVWHVLLAFTSAPNASWRLLLILFLCSVIENCISSVCTQPRVLFNIIWMKYVITCPPHHIFGFVFVCACLYFAIKCAFDNYFVHSINHKKELGQHILTWWRIIRKSGAAQSVAESSYITNNK